MFQNSHSGHKWKLVPTRIMPAISFTRTGKHFALFTLLNILAKSTKIQASILAFD